MKFRIYESNEIRSSYYDGDVYYWDGESEVPEDVTKVVIQDGVTFIDDYAFYYRRWLTSITMPDSITSIGNYAFYWCIKLASVTIGNGVTTIGDQAFFHCVSLTSITIPNSVTLIGDRVFSGCTRLTSIMIPNSITSISPHAFSYCDSFTSITIPNSVTEIDDSAFLGCENLKSVIFKGDPSKIKFGKGVFDKTPYEKEFKRLFNIPNVDIKNINIADTDINIDTKKIKFVKLSDEVFEGEAAEKVISKKLRTPIDNLVVVKFSTSDGSIDFDSFENLDQYLGELAEDELSVNDDFDINTLTTICNVDGIKFVDIGDYDEFNKTEYTRYLVFKNKSDAKKLLVKLTRN